MIAKITIKEVKDRIGEVCKEQRKAHGVSQNELAKALGMSRITIQNVENGNNATLETLLKIAKHFSLLEDVFRAIDASDNKSDLNSLY